MQTPKRSPKCSNYLLGFSHGPTVQVWISQMLIEKSKIPLAIHDKSWDKSWKNLHARFLNNLGVGKSLLQNIPSKYEINSFSRVLAYLARQTTQRFCVNFKLLFANGHVHTWRYTCFFVSTKPFVPKKTFPRFIYHAYIRYSYKQKVTHALSWILTFWVQYIISKGFTKLFDSGFGSQVHEPPSHVISSSGDSNKQRSCQLDSSNWTRE